MTVAYDPMTQLSTEHAALLAEWLSVPESRSPLVLPNATTSGGDLRVNRDDNGSVWITPTP